MEDWVPDFAGGAPDLNDWVLDFGNWVPDLEDWVPDLKKWAPDLEDWVPDLENWAPDLEEALPDLELKQAESRPWLISVSTLIAGECRSMHPGLFYDVCCPYRDPIWDYNQEKHIVYDTCKANASTSAPEGYPDI